MDLMAATTRNENLTKKVEEMQNNEQANTTKVFNIVKENKTLEDKVSELQNNINNVNQKLAAEQQKSKQAEKSLKDAQLEITAQEEKFKAATANLQRAVQDTATEKENIRRELQDSLNQVTREKDFMRIEKEQMRKEKSMLIDSLKNVAEWSQSMIHMYEMKQKTVDNMVKHQSTKFQDLKGEIQKLSSTVNGIIAEAQSRLEENQRLLEEQKSKIDSDNSKSSNALVDSLKKVAELEEEVQKAKASVQAAVAAALDAQESKRQVLEMKLENLNNVIEALEIDAETSAQQKDKSDKAIEDLERTIEVLRDQLANKVSCIDELKAQQSVSYKVSEDLNQQAEELKKQLSRQEQLLAEIADKETASKEAIFAKDSEIQELKSKNDPGQDASPENKDPPQNTASSSNISNEDGVADTKSMEAEASNEHHAVGGYEMTDEDVDIDNTFSAAKSSPLSTQLDNTGPKSTSPKIIQALSPPHSSSKLQESNTFSPMSSPLQSSSAQSDNTGPNDTSSKPFHKLSIAPSSNLKESSMLLIDNSSQTEEPEMVTTGTQTHTVDKKHHAGKHHSAQHHGSSSDAAKVPPLVGMVSETDDKSNRRNEIGKKEKAHASKLPIVSEGHEHEKKHKVKHHERRDDKPDSKSAKNRNTQDDDKTEGKRDEHEADEADNIVHKNNGENDGGNYAETEKEPEIVNKLSGEEATKDAEQHTPVTNDANHKENNDDTGQDSELSESEEDSDLFIPKSTVEEIVHKSLVTYNLYYSEEEAAFTSQYPIDKRFLESLINSFDKIGQKLCEMSDTVHTITGKLFKADISKHRHHSHIHNHHHNKTYTAAVAAEVEKVIEFCAKRLVIDFEKSKAYSLAKLLESLEDGTHSVESLQRANSSSEFKGPAEPSERRSGWAKLANATESKKPVVPSLSYIDRANESKNINKKEANSSWNSLRQLMATHAFRYQKKEPHMLKSVTNLMSYQKTAKDNKALSESEQAYLDSIENVSVKIDIELPENMDLLRKELRQGALLDLGKISG